MVLSETEAESRLAELRQRREAIEREIRDLTLYLELGRRLVAEEPEPAHAAPGSPATPRGPDARPDRVTADPSGASLSDESGRIDTAPAASGAAAPAQEAGHPAGTVAEATQALRAALRAQASATPLAACAAPDPGPSPPPPPGWPAPGSASSGSPAYQAPVSEGAQARRYGRALVAQTLAILEQARRPLHASEILAALEARGFSVPGHDPVAALNTRLWKRAGPDGVLRRLGDAVYALPPVDETEE